MFKCFRKCFVCGMRSGPVLLKYLDQPTIYGGPRGIHYAYHDPCLDLVLRNPQFYADLGKISIVEKAIEVEQILRDREFKQLRIRQQTQDVINRAGSLRRDRGILTEKSKLEKVPEPSSDTEKSESVQNTQQLSRYDILRSR